MNSVRRLPLRPLISGLVFFLLLTALFPAAEAATPSGQFADVIRTLSATGNRHTGTPGYVQAADYVRQAFTDIGIENVRTHRFSVPILHHDSSTLTLPDADRPFPLLPIRGNAITPETIPPEGLDGPLFYVGNGDLKDFNGKPVNGAILLMEMDSGRNWLNAANLGARALIYVNRGVTSRLSFQEKIELSPIQFPRFWIPVAQAREMFGDFETIPNGKIASRVELNSDIRWKRTPAENIYGIIPGTDPELAEELLLVEAFYDSTAYVIGRSPAADAACSIATLLAVGRHFTAHPPKRAILLLATAGHAQRLAGMREAIWAVRSRHKDLRDEERRLEVIHQTSREMIDALEHPHFEAMTADTEGRPLKEALEDRIKTEVHTISQRLVRLRMKPKEEQDEEAIRKLAEKRFLLRRLGWMKDFSNVPEAEREVLAELIPGAIENYRLILTDADRALREIKSAKQFRSAVKEREIMGAVSLHLSSHGEGVGAFNYGFLHDIKPNINRIEPYSFIDETLRRSAKADTAADTVRFWDTLRPSARRSWQSYFRDRPFMGGEITALAGYLGFTLATVHDARPLWGTPFDVPERVDYDYAIRQSNRVQSLIAALADAPELYTGNLPRNGFASVTGRAKLLRHGELFADMAAPGTMILAYQGDAYYHAMTDATGVFHLRGMSTKKLVLGKVIIEGYRFDPNTGEVIWAIDKKETGKSAYRVKMRRHDMETDLILFAAEQTTIFNLLEPRTFRYMTKLKLLDARRESLPLRYWYSRIDTRESIISSIYLPSGTHLKLTHSDTVLRNKMVLTNGTPDNPTGSGYLVDEWPVITCTDFRVAKDMWTLLGPRVHNLEAHGIHNERIQRLREEGMEALQRAETALEGMQYDRFAVDSARSWALASRVYNHVEETQKDVLFGVLFYIALFVPFAFCMERLLIGSRNIHKRIVAFLVILLLLIAVIYQVHPAFQLAYSPTVVVLAFFIMGLSLMVTLIIFFRFENEMVLLQRRARQMRAEEISRWKAFVSAFFLGVSNLRRRRLRTTLTCATLIILTFTIMSFTSVKSIRHHARILYQEDAAYHGLLLKNANWTDLPPESLGVIINAFEEMGPAAPRVWLEDEDRTRTVPVPLRSGEGSFLARGMIGLSHREPSVSGIERILTGGRWLAAGDQNAILLPERIAVALGIDPRSPAEEEISLWGVPFTVVGVFSGTAFQQFTDLDGEPLTPVTFPTEETVAMTEVEAEALESGEDVRAFQSRYQHVDGDLTVIIPYRTLLAENGNLKAVAVRPDNPEIIPETARDISDRFGLTLFSGEPEGTFMYNASDTLNYSGVPNIVIPLVISVFIVLNTMIGSVYERKSEIGIYTSVGLAPSHVSFLFIAEALAFAVLSVVLGYLLAQVSASLFAGTALWAGITVNYSSLAGVASMILVILVVLVSVVYPSRVAAEIAIPDVNRSWSMPEVNENTLELTLPFLVKYEEHDSIAGFLLAHFQGHQDVSHGLFSADDIETAFVCPAMPEPVPEQSGCILDASGRPACIMLTVRVWLAPFDFGIMQRVELSFCPSREDRRFLDIRVRLMRETGEANAWKRINKAFLNALRKQLLIWRSLPPEEQRLHESMITSAREKEYPAAESAA